MAETVIGMGAGQKEADPKLKELESKIAEETSAKEEALAEKAQFEEGVKSLTDKLAEETSAKENALAEKTQLENTVKSMKAELDKANKTIEKLSKKTTGGSNNGTSPKGSTGGSQEPQA